MENLTINLQKLRKSESINIQPFFEKMEYIHKNHKDYLIDQEKNLNYFVQGNKPFMAIPKMSNAAFEILPNAMNQTTESLNIPRMFSDRLLKDKPDLWQHLLNNLSADSEKPRLIRTIDQSSRAVLSNRFKTIDNYGIFFESLKAIQDFKPEFYGASLTYDNMYLRAGFPTVQAEIKKDDIVEAGIFIKNSETGNGRFEASLYINRLFCLNGMISKDNSLSRTHLGKRREFDASQQVIEAEARLIKEEVKDILVKALNPAAFDRTVKALRESTEIKIDKPIEEINNLGIAFEMSEIEQKNLLSAFVQNKDYTVFGEIQAVTQIAKECSPDRRTILEGMANDLLKFG